jgi:hypothetical protein
MYVFRFTFYISSFFFSSQYSNLYFLTIILQIISSINHCAIYEFNEERSGWSKMNIEGPAFLVKRADGSAPSYRMWVLNRVGRHNLKQDITATLETALNQGFHMFREASHTEQGLHSMWFPDSEKEKGAAFFSTLSQLSDAEKRKVRIPTSQSSDHRGGQGRSNGNGSGTVVGEKVANNSTVAQDWTGGESTGKALLAMLKGTPIAAAAGGSLSTISSNTGTASTQSACPIPTGVQTSTGATSSVSPSVAALFSNAAAAAAAAAANSSTVTSTQYTYGQTSISPPAPPLLQQLMSSAATSSTTLTPSKVSTSSSSDATPPPPPATVARRNGDDFLHAPLTLNKDQLKSLLLELVNEDAFVDLLHASYLKNEAKKRAQRIL